MEVFKFFAEVFREFGAGNTAQLIILGLFAWFFIKILPQAVERVVKAIEDLGKVFAVHEERSILLQQTVLSIQADLRCVQTNSPTKETINKIHDRINDLPTKDDFNLFIDELRRHGEECEKRGSRILDNSVRR